jgi:hypothetical protein
VRRAALLLAGSALAAVACIPSDDSPTLGAAAFTIGVTGKTALAQYEPGFATTDGWRVRWDRILLGFKTMTIGKQGVPDQCQYRGRGELKNVVVDPFVGATQIFDGIQPVDCPDVGIILGPPDGATTLGPGTSPADIVELSVPSPAQAVVRATLFPPASADPPEKIYQLVLRFDDRAPTRFAGCGVLGADAVSGPGEGGVPTRGARIVAGARDQIMVKFAAEALLVLPDRLNTGAIRAELFVQADLLGNGDGIITMDELDGSDAGDNLRALFGGTIRYRIDSGACKAIAPGAPEP